MVPPTGQWLLRVEFLFYIMELGVQVGQRAREEEQTVCCFPPSPWPSYQHTEEASAEP